METVQINGFLFEKLLYNALANLRQMEETLNSLNVFPVADGDTGTNMRLTLENGLRYAEPCEQLSTYMRALNDGLLLGARGNSGVILSQLFRGMHTHLSDCSAASCFDMQNAFIQAYKTAYRAVVQPIEGTILTVSREGIEKAHERLGHGTSIETLFETYVTEMKRSLDNTPEMLEILKASGVVDSGALGYITIIEGMSKYFKGEILSLDAPLSQSEAKSDGQQKLSLSAFTADSSFIEGYCMEFILQLMHASPCAADFTIERYIEELRPLGNSIAATRDGMRVKVHIHTKAPAPVITASQKYGEFLTFKLENMQLQHNEQVEKKNKKSVTYTKPIGIVAVYSGDGMRDEFEGLGCDVTIDGGATMNPPSSEFLSAYETIDADNIVVLPNSKNVIFAAEQAAGLAKRKNIHVFPTRSVAEGYFAIAMDVGNSKDVQKRLESMRSGFENVITLSVALATKSYSDGDVSCTPGDYVAVIGDKPVFASKDPIEAFLGGLSTIEDVDDRETCMVFCGESADDTLVDTLTDAVSEGYPSLEISFVEGGQHTYMFTCGIV